MQHNIIVQWHKDLPNSPIPMDNRPISPCVMSVDCLLKLLVIIIIIIIADTFLPYGANVGDTEAVESNDELIGPISLNIPIVLYNKNLTSLYVRSCMDGINHSFIIMIFMASKSRTLSRCFMPLLYII